MDISTFSGKIGTFDGLHYGKFLVKIVHFDSSELHISDLDEISRMGLLKVFTKLSLITKIMNIFKHNITVQVLTLNYPKIKKVN